MPGPLAVCTFCGTEVDPYAHTTYQKESGWSHRREGGGTNALALAQKHDEWACWTCIDKLKAGIPLEQQSLV